MAVEAQYPSNVIMPNFCDRIRQDSTSEHRNLISSAPFIVPEDFHLHPEAASLLQMYNSDLNLTHQCMLKDGVLNEMENDLASGSRKRPRDGENLLARQQAFNSLLNLQQQQQNHADPAFVSPQTQTETPPISTGLHLSFGDIRINPAMDYATVRSTASSFSSVLQNELQREIMKHKEEINHFIFLQGEQMKHALEEKRQKHVRYLLASIEGHILKSLKDKEAELHKVTRRNLELEECVKQLSLSSLLWQNMAKNNEVMASTLRASLEQIVDTQDAESCHYGEVDDAQARTFKENKELKEQRTCRACRTNDVSILLLPCRHLCLCKDCETRLDVCPLCSSKKNASLQVYMS